jgi:glucan phosphoethanolaminetransferase (alkaline phosphatase superfamily)
MNRSQKSEINVKAEPSIQRSFRVEREFGLIVGAVFTLLSAWWLYRAKSIGVAQVTLPLGVALMLLGLIFPRSLVYPNRAWILLAEALAYVSTCIILGIVFFAIVTPIGVIKRMFGWDPLHRREVSGLSYWRPYSDRQRDPRHYERMF